MERYTWRLAVGLLVSGYCLLAFGEPPSDPKQAAPLVAEDPANAVVAPADDEAAWTGKNPFKGVSREYEHQAAKLRLETMKARIAEQELAQVKADAEKKRWLHGEPTQVAQPAQAAGSMVERRAAQALSEAGERPGTETRARPSRSRHALHAKRKVNDGQAPGDPKLVGYSEIDGKRYAVLEQNKRTLIVPAGGTRNGVRVANIESDSALVNGRLQTFQVGQQRIVVAAPASATGASPMRAATGVAQSPPLSVPLPAGENLSGPQPYGSGSMGVEIPPAGKGYPLSSSATVDRWCRCWPGRLSLI
jgi:hypothetical protein